MRVRKDRKEAVDRVGQTNEGGVDKGVTGGAG